VAFVRAVALVAAIMLSAVAAGAASPEKSARAAWTHGPSSDPNYFPIAVWLQDPGKAAAYKAAGINLYVGLWEGPTEGQLAALTKAGMPVICDQNAVGLKHKDDPIIVGWMHGDEPDNAQSLPSGKGYGPPILPEKIIADYQRLRAADPTRPVMLNLGQGVAWDGYYGRGVRTNHPEDYPEYAKGCDIVSFDIYPVVHDKPAVRGKLEFVARGVERLVKWTAGKKVVWNCIECTRISSDRKATPAQVKAEVWMSLIHGSRGLIYFVHEWKPKFNEHALLDDPEMLKAVTAVNAQIASLAPVLNSDTVRAHSPEIPADWKPQPGAEAPVAWMMKRLDGAVYVFAANMRDCKGRGGIRDEALRAGMTAEVLGEGRSVKVGDGRLEDDFEPYAVHLYRIRQ
jgi:hypothetical protein